MEILAVEKEKMPSQSIDSEYAQVTKLKSTPHQMLGQDRPGRPAKLPVSPVKMLAGRESNYSGRGRFSSADSCHLSSRYLPVNGPSFIDQMASSIYVSQFSADGSLFVSGLKRGQVVIYDVDRKWKIHKSILTKSVRGSITDATFSPDQRFLAYGCMSPNVHIVDTGYTGTDSQANEVHGLDFSANNIRGYSFGIFSLKFSTDGRELIGGSNDDSIYVYDLEANKLSFRIISHMSDVNAVCFADETSNLIYSGSDDSSCKVWDRRCLRADGKAAGVLMGHLEGVTFINSRGDGRYLISNSKDQTIKLWDIRKMSSNVDYNPLFRCYEWDYRWMDFPPQSIELNPPCDLSVATYRGHSVLRTLVRCYFSPAFSTGQRYIYTGSHNGRVFIYDSLSAAPVATMKHFNRAPVRDCSWHPFEPTLVSSSWGGDIVKWTRNQNRFIE